MDRKIKILSALLIFVVFVFVFTRIFTGVLFAEETTEYPVSASIVKPVVNGTSQKIGISVDRDVINFGIVPTGTSVRKSIEISNKDNMPVKIHLDASGNISEFLDFEKNNFILGENTVKDVQVRLLGTKTGNYSGQVLVTAKRPAFKWLGWIVPWL